MGRRMTQTIHICDDCGETPYDGDYLWEMCGKMICEKCIDTHGEDEEEDE